MTSFYRQQRQMFDTARTSSGDQGRLAEAGNGYLAVCVTSMSAREATQRVCRGTLTIPHPGKRNNRDPGEAVNKAQATWFWAGNSPETTFQGTSRGDIPCDA